MGKESNFIAPILIDAAGRAEDAARIEALGGFRVQDPVTPKVVPPKRQYINKDGFMTQNRPMNPFEVSPRSAEDDALPLVQFDSFDTQTQTQLETQSPTRIPSNRSKSSFTERAPSPTELQATEEQHEEEEDSQLGLPSAQPRPPVPRNAFDVLLAPAPIAPAPKTKANRANVGNAFIDTEANLSDEEIMGMGLGETGSGDEDETREDFDSELMELVDNEKVEEELLLQQDRLARERAALV